MDPNDPRSRHVYDFMEMVGHVQPIAFVMENVAALAVNSRWSDVREWLIERGRMLGYHTQIHLVKASDFGIPQARERMFLVGLPPRVAGGFRLEPTTRASPPTVREALSALPPYGSPGNSTVATAKITFAKKPVLRKSPFAGMLFNGQGRPLNLDAPALTLPASMGGNRTPIIDQSQLDEGGNHWIVEYHSHLLAGGTPYEGEAPERLRRLTVEEAAALQTFGESMTFEGSQSSQFRQIGNAVPPKLATVVATSLLSCLDEYGEDAQTREMNREALFAAEAFAS
jgi:DNA (cytosine-5)-methyltransferase 1